MSIIAINVNTTGLVGDSVNPRRCTLITTDNLTTITTAGYLNNQNLLGNTILPTDIFDILYSYNTSTNSGTFGMFTLTYSSSTGFTLVSWANPGDVLLPVVNGDFANFNGTSGQIKDAGYSPSSSSKTKVVMANGSVTANHIGTFTDTAGTLGQDAATAINAGNIQAGLSGTAGTLASFPGTAANGSMKMAAVNNAGNHILTLSNISSLGQDTTLTFNDPGASTANVIVSTAGSAQTIAGGLTISTGNLGVSQGNVTAGSSGHAGTITTFPGTASNGTLVIAAVNNTSNHAMTVSNDAPIGQDTTIKIPDPGAATSFVSLAQSAATAITNKVFVKTITATAGALATSGHVSVMAAPSGTSQFKILNIRVMYAASGLSGGGGDRLITLTDGTIVFNQAGITAALLGTPVYTLWGGTGNPLPGSVSTISTAGAAIYLVYSGGTTDYTTGQIVIEIELAQVTA